jgi:hypothetical protein
MLHARKDYQARIQDVAGLIPADEPVFFIRGQDEAAPDTLRFWAETAQHLGASAEIVQLVRDHADRMDEWQRTRASKVPDLPA